MLLHDEEAGIQGVGNRSGVKNDNPSNSIDIAVKQLAELSPLKYDRIRMSEAKALGVRVSVLDTAVKEVRNGKIDTKSFFAEVPLWPEVIPASLLTEIASTIQRFAICTPEVSNAAALWVAMTWFIDVIDVAPLAVITAPEKRCGKTLLLTLLGKLVKRPITASNISPAALFRTIDAWNPTLLIDEADSFVKDNNELRGLLNCGHTRDSAYTIRTVGENFIPTKFNTWGAKALAGIGHVADTLMDRAIVLELRRKLPHEKVERIRQAEPGLFDNLRSKLARFAKDYSEQVRQARPLLPEGLNDRAQDNWEPLLAIAMIAGPEWLQIGMKASLKLSGSESASQTKGTELLSDIRDIFDKIKDDKISTAQLITALTDDDEKPWSMYKNGEKITARQLAGLLKGYGIQSKTIRIGEDTPKGYKLEQFLDAFSRYLPHSSENNRHMPQALLAKGLPVFDDKCPTATSATTPHNVLDNPPRCGCKKGEELPNQSLLKDSCVVADKNSLFVQTELFSEI